MKRLLYNPFFFLTLTLMLVLGYFNRVETSLNLVFIRFNIEVAALIGATLFLGFVFGLLATLFMVKKNQRLERAKQRKLANKE